MIKRYTLSFMAMAFSLAGTASAGTIALTFTGGSAPLNIFQGVMAGWRFQTNSAITVDSLGVFDFNGAGLAGTHEVGIWDNVGTLLGSAIVPAGNAGTLTNSFRFTPVAPINLPANQLFTIAAFYATQGDYLVNFFAVVATDPSINYVDRATSLTNSFSFPINFNTVDLAGDFGPDFTIVTTRSAVPEPTSFVFLGTGLALVAVRRKLQRR